MVIPDGAQRMLDPVRNLYYYYDPVDRCYVYENGDVVYEE